MSKSLVEFQILFSNYLLEVNDDDKDNILIAQLEIFEFVDKLIKENQQLRNEVDESNIWKRINSWVREEFRPNPKTPTMQNNTTEPRNDNYDCFGNIH